MPELPEVETVLRSLAPHVTGHAITDVDVRCGALRKPLPDDFADRLRGRTISSLSRRAKYLLFEMDAGPALLVHLGMSGRLLHTASLAAHVPQKHDHVAIVLDDGGVLIFNDPRRFGLMVLDDPATSPLLAQIGPEPLDVDAFTPDYLAGVRRKTNRTVKDVLMDQRVVAGLGNIYVNELLWLGGIRPRRRAARLTKAECERLVECTRTIIGEAIEHRGSSISDFLDGIGRRGGYQWRRRVYDRDGEPCPRCGEVIKSVVVGQRSSFYCPRCQR